MTVPGIGGYDDRALREEKRRRQAAMDRRLGTSRDVVVPAKDFTPDKVDELRMLVEYQAEKHQFKSMPFSNSPSTFAGMDRDRTIDMLREGADSVLLAPQEEKKDAKNWFVKALTSAGRSLAGLPGIEQTLGWMGSETGQKWLDPIQAGAEVSASLVYLQFQKLMPGEQELERLYNDQREALGMSNALPGWLNALPLASAIQFNIDLIGDFPDLISSPTAYRDAPSIESLRGAWQEWDAPWGV